MDQELLHTATELAWQHWTALGVSGVAPVPGYAIDLEALIAFTPFVAQADPRLGAESMDWCVRIGPRHLSVSRLRQVARLFEPYRELDYIDLAGIAIGATVGRTDKLKISGKSRQPRLNHPALLQLRSRRIFGVGARADVVIALITRARDEGAPGSSTLAPIGYTKRAVASVLEDFASVDIVDKLVVNQTARYKLLRESSLRSLLAPVPTKAPQWIERFAITAALLSTWKRMGGHSPAGYAVEVARVLKNLRTHAATIGEKPPTTGRPPVLLAQVARWSKTLLNP
jgi:hypothetical protein